MEKILQVNHLSVDFKGFKAVNEVSMAVAEGELRVIIGPNGAGKSTLMDLITGKTSPTQGSIRFCGHDITGKDPSLIASQYGIGRKFQGPNLFDNMTVGENIEVALKGFTNVKKSLFYRRTAQIKKHIDEIIEQISLSAKKDIVATSLSHGERQWLEIGMVIAQDPKLIILDEPTAGMTQDETYKTGEIIKMLLDNHTVLVVEHDMAFVRQVAQTITVLHQGRVLAEGPYDEISQNPEVVQVYLKEDNGGDDNAED